jgi:hypothetical protein
VVRISHIEHLKSLLARVRAPFRGLKCLIFTTSTARRWTLDGCLRGGHRAPSRVNVWGDLRLSFRNNGRQRLSKRQDC